ncbi:pH adaptation potassium efflux protein [Bordetella pertussis]|nr:Na+/H+ antiporter subunit E [Bordetella pertussis]ETA65125.1 Na+/H+ ion antiporter subunit [Bordetella pertussis CHLA-11]ETH01129.1 Na+/H+ ion antiporter subunit [Bordetella pertussis 2250905]ETH05635.1 Na+/H+ ion antiporter subunit [Bordetella pertussis 2356847]ETH06856.1 Na+/H+ ion antiporter subunit [Bordetella pertussis 2371640]ETH13802.1 Na+/H+ ion antiporter subunit [Bordetella pertussis STO1-SEAT-0006]ETH17058.1 Na+/H+ ion antiporter subunit [Bordetella pertussis STO1-SEAT-0007]ETH
MRRYYLALLPLAMLALWLMLNQSASIGQLALGAALALWLGWASSRLRPLRGKPRSLWLLPGLAARVFADIVRSNVAVARLVWQRRPDFSPGFIAIPLDLHDPHGLAILACIVTYTPGTVWVDIIDGKLVLHVLDLQNEEAWIALVKQRYERTLIEVFE